MKQSIRISKHIVLVFFFLCIFITNNAQVLRTEDNFSRLDSVEISTIFRENQVEKNTPWNLNNVNIIKESNKFSSTGRYN
jgi:predicted RND superfamily exporter protein